MSWCLLSQSPREDEPLNSGNRKVIFQAKWPSMCKSRLLLSHVMHRVVLVVVALRLVIGLIFGNTFAFKSEMCTVSVVVMVVITLTDFPVCGWRSFLGSALILLVFTSFAYAVHQNPNIVTNMSIEIPMLWILTYTIVRLIVGFLVVPAQFSFNGLRGHFPSLCTFPQHVIDAARASLIADIFGETVHLRTADGVDIDAMMFWSEESRRRRDQMEIVGVDSQLIPQPSLAMAVAILFNGNNESFEFRQDEISLYLRHGLSVLTFNYRGVSASGGCTSRDGLVLDADACYQYVHHTLGVPARLICLIGTSLGGAVATELATFREGCVLCNDRSFSSLSLEASFVAPIMFGIEAKTWKSRLFSSVVRYFLHYSGWEFDAARNWATIRGHKFLQFHSEDLVIPEPARLITALRHSTPPPKVIELKPSEDDDDTDEWTKGQIAHCRMLSREEFRQHMMELRAGLH